MKILFDTNVLIPLEPTSSSDAEAGTPNAVELIRFSFSGKHQVYYHPATKRDIEQDRDGQRRDLRQILLSKYLELSHPPVVTKAMEAAVGTAAEGTNDWVDNQLLAAVAGNSVDILVTEDQDIFRKANRLELEDRVLSVKQAIAYIHDLFDKTPSPPPAIRNVKAHELEEDDPIFGSLRADYRDFNGWMAKCKREHRQAWVVDVLGAGYGALAIVKPEEKPDVQLRGKVLKVCTFKVSENHDGLKLGELLLKAVLEFATTNGYDWLYLTTHPKQAQLIGFMAAFGFEEAGTKASTGEVVLSKPLTFSLEEYYSLGPLAFHIRFGPLAFKKVVVPAFVVPILPRYHGMLFPELEPQVELLPGRAPFGNSIRKAYLCHSKIRKIEPGSVLLFYRSREKPRVVTVGIAERTFVSGDPVKITQFVGKRTVYRFEEIEKMSNGQEVLAILFRQARRLAEPIALSELKEHGALTGAPQSIVTVRNGSPNGWKGSLAFDTPALRRAYHGRQEAGGVSEGPVCEGCFSRRDVCNVPGQESGWDLRGRRHRGRLH
jgi:GNAT superfamily N-acetyltransferase/predicted RNA-binding protein with PUA-like domain